MDNTIHDIHGILDLIKEGKIEPITMWKYYVSKWDIEEQRTLLIKLIGISTKEKREFRQGSDLDRIASYHSSYLSRKINEYTQSSTTQNETDIPSTINTEKAKKYFTRAIEHGFIEKINDRYKWTYGGDKGQIRLGYFCSKVFDAPRPINDLECLFNVRKLSSSITNSIYNDSKRNDVKKWKEEIDKLFFD